MYDPHSPGIRVEDWFFYTVSEFSGTSDRCLLDCSHATRASRTVNEEFHCSCEIISGKPFWFVVSSVQIVDRMATPEENKEIVRRLDVIWDGEVEVVDEIVAEDLTNHNSLVPDAPPGPEGFKQNVSALRTAFPDINFTTEDIIAEGDKVVFRAVGHGTHEGGLMGIEPTGREVTLSGIVIFRIADGQIVERWAQFDTIGMLRQIGALPAPGNLSGSDSEEDENHNL